MTEGEDLEKVSFELQVGGRTASFDAEVTEVTKSLHTGAALRHAESSVSVTDEFVEPFRKVLEAGVHDAQGQEWFGRISSQSYRNGEPHQLEIEWTQRETLAASLLEFEGLTLKPSSYDEEADDDAIVITLRAALSADETKQLRAIQTRSDDELYWPVIRRGVSDTPLRMRFGRVLWQPLEDDRFAHQITLVEASYDENPGNSSPRSFGGEPMVSNLMRAVSILDAQMRDLVSKLETSGHISSEDATALIEDARTQRLNRRDFRFYEVSDLDQW